MTCVSGDAPASLWHPHRPPAALTHTSSFCVALPERPRSMSRPSPRTGLSSAPTTMVPRALRIGHRASTRPAGSARAVWCRSSRAHFWPPGRAHLLSGARQLALRSRGARAARRGAMLLTTAASRRAAVVAAAAAADGGQAKVRFFSPPTPVGHRPAAASAAPLRASRARRWSDMQRFYLCAASRGTGRTSAPGRGGALGGEHDAARQGPRVRHRGRESPRTHF